MKSLNSAGIVVYYELRGTIEYLLLHYPAGHWDFSKGKLEKGESNQEAALRELAEETGIQEVEILPEFQESFSYFFTDYDGKKTHKTVDFFVGKVHDKKVTLSFEHQGYVWLPYQEALKKLTYQNAKDLLQKVNQFIDSL